MPWTVEHWRRVTGLEHGFGSRHETAPAGVITLRQVHGRTVRVASEIPRAGTEGDGVIVSRAGEGAAIRTADCVPVLLIAPSDRVAAALHAGWRGVGAGIVDAALERFECEWNVAPGAVEAALGPSIGGCCYEVGEEVRDAFHDAWGKDGEHGFDCRDGSLFLDLRRSLEIRLHKLGVTRIAHVGPCTGCNPSVLCSYRKEGPSTGRQHTWIRWR